MQERVRVDVTWMNLATDDEAFKEFLLKHSTFMAVLVDGRFIMDFAAYWSKRIEKMLNYRRW